MSSSANLHRLTRMTAQPHEHLTDAVLRPVRGHHAFEGCVEQLATAIRLGPALSTDALHPSNRVSGSDIARMTLSESSWEPR